MPVIRYAIAMISLDELADAIRAARRLRRLGLDEDETGADAATIHETPPEPDHLEPPAAIS